MKSELTTEKRINASNYLYQFQQETQELTHQYAIYCGLLLEIKAATENTQNNTSLTIPDNYKNPLTQINQNIRYYCIKLYISYSTIQKSLNQAPDPKITEIYTKIQSKALILSEDLEIFVTLINEYTIQDTMQQLLETSSAFISKIYTPTQ